MDCSAFVIAATKSGSGKTLLTLGIMAALVRRGLRMQPFKCGPDFIDPTLHKMVAGSTSRNLDLFMMGADCCRQTFASSSEGSDVQVVEGVMGLFDGGISPLADRCLPAGTDAVYIGGGYPELHAGNLSANSSMKSSLRRWVEDGGVLYCECGGLMYMSRDLAGADGRVFPMVDVFPMRMVMKDRFSRLGYRTVSLMRDCLLGREGEVLHGHEFHYSEIGEEAAATDCLYRLEDGRREGYCQNNALGSYVHLHFARSAGNVAHLYQYTLRQRQKGEQP